MGMTFTIILLILAAFATGWYVGHKMGIDDALHRELDY